jgi:cation diffusion facilitator CzcD-associated flavoprotein CzcO
VKVLLAHECRHHDFQGQSVGVLLPADLAARVVPTVVETARSVKVFQEEPVWVVPVPLPLRRLARLHLRLGVKDPWTRRLLTPGRFGRHDMVVSSAYYDALQQQNCKLVAWPVYAIVDEGVRTAEGIEHRVDVLVVHRTGRKALAA